MGDSKSSQKLIRVLVIKVLNGRKGRGVRDCDLRFHLSVFWRELQHGNRNFPCLQFRSFRKNLHCELIGQ